MERRFELRTVASWREVLFIDSAPPSGAAAGRPQRAGGFEGKRPIAKKKTPAAAPRGGRTCTVRSGRELFEHSNQPHVACVGRRSKCQSAEAVPGRGVLALKLSLVVRLATQLGDAGAGQSEPHGDAVHRLTSRPQLGDAAITLGERIEPTDARSTRWHRPMLR